MAATNTSSLAAVLDGVPVDQVCLPTIIDMSHNYSIGVFSLHPSDVQSPRNGVKRSQTPAHLSPRDKRGPIGLEQPTHQPIKLIEVMNKNDCRFRKHSFGTIDWLRSNLGSRVRWVRLE